MNYAITQIKEARHIARTAEKQINAITGLRMRVVLYTTEDRKKPEQMLQVVAKALGMHNECYTAKTRKREIVDLRFISSLLLRKFYPRVTLKQIAAFYGGQDHTSIINGVLRAGNLLETCNMNFTKKYNTALNAVTLWLKD